MKFPLFVTADWHLGHESLIEYDNRPFSNVDYMEKVLIKRFNSIVPKNGTTFFAGDMGHHDRVSKVLKELNGTHILIIGNHDKGFYSAWNCGYKLVVYNATLYIDKERVTISHCPLMGVKREDTSSFSNTEENWHKEKYNEKYSVKNNGQFHLHGHIHARKDKSISKIKDGRQWDIGVTGNNYMPVSFSEIQKWIRETKLLESQAQR